MRQGVKQQGVKPAYPDPYAELHVHDVEEDDNSEDNVKFVNNMNTLPLNFAWSGGVEEASGRGQGQVEVSQLPFCSHFSDKEHNVSIFLTYECITYNMDFVCRMFWHCPNREHSATLQLRVCRQGRWLGLGL
jgi:hypothetical protein